MAQETVQGGMGPAGMDADRTAQADLNLSGKYMTFKLAAEVYGLEILKVREIIGMMDITRVPRTAAFIRGVINLRGKVIPVMDLRCKFGMESAEATDQTVIIVVQLSTKEEGEFTMGILVDEVLEVLLIKGDQIEPPPDFGSNTVDQEFILGIGKSEKRVIFLLNIAKVLSSDETGQIVHLNGNSQKSGVEDA